VFHLSPTEFRLIVRRIKVLTNQGSAS
jgi:hypothetical protein